MSPGTRRRQALRGAVGKCRFPLLALLLTSLLGLAWPVPAVDAQAAPAPPRPLLLIGGTFVGNDFAGFGGIWSWDQVKEWLADEGGYDLTPDSDNRDLLLVGEMPRQGTRPPNWDLRPADIPEWPDFVGLLGLFELSTAGLVPMHDSVDSVKGQIAFASALAGGGEIDVIAHSQGAAIVRGAIRELVEEGSDNPVRSMISLGGGNYGGSTHGPEFALFSPDIVADCRDDGWLPVCPDIIRRGFPSGIPNPDNPDPALHATGFYPWLNGAGGGGPLPGLGSTTTYFNIFSRRWAADRPDETHAAEVIPLFPARLPWTNWNVQDFCDDPGDDPVYPVHHNEEWGNPATQELMLAALGIRAADPGVC